MRVRAKVTLVLALLFAGLIAAQWAIEQRLMLPRFVELERDSARTDMQRVAFAVEREQQALAAQAADWGNWRELWRYMEDHNPGFANASLTDNSVRTAKIDYMAVMAADGHLDWSHGVDATSGRTLAIELNRSGRLEPSWARSLAQGQAVSGLIATNAGVLLASGAPILDGLGRGPARGMVIMGRLLDQPELLRLGTQAQVSLDMRLLNRATPGERSLPSVTAGADGWLSETDTHTRIERAFGNLSGEPLLTLGINVPRTISRHGANAVRYSALLLSIAACIALAALLLLLGRIVLTPLATVTEHSQRIAASDDLSARLSYRRDDELGALASAFDNMVERLASTRRELIDRSFESGAAENASGVLHNLGNAMTPLSVNISSLQQQFAALPTDDLQLALTELQLQPTDAARHHDLQRFVQLAAAELARTLRLGSDQLRRIADQTGIILAVLAEQRQHLRSGPVLQSVTPAELVARSLEQIAPVHRARLQLQLSPGLAALGALPLPATTLGMVLQNLLQNAAEAAAQAGLARTPLRISATIDEQFGRRGLRFVISDEAAGVAADHLHRLFEKGFSTKSQAANSGLGLHWCANTLHALGGRIDAYSDGIGRGARFEFFIPLQPTAVSAEERVA